METKAIYKRIADVIESIERNKRVRELFTNAGATDMKPFDHRAHMLEVRFALLEHALKLHHTEQMTMAWAGLKASVKEAFTPNKLRA